MANRSHAAPTPRVVLLLLLLLAVLVLLGGAPAAAADGSSRKMRLAGASGQGECTSLARRNVRAAERGRWSAVARGERGGEDGRPRPASHDAPAPRPPAPRPRRAGIVSNCLQLEAAVNAFSADASAGGDYVRRTITLACSGSFRCYAPGRAGQNRSITLSVFGHGSLTIAAQASCATGSRRPRVSGGDPAALAAAATPLVYVGTPVRDDPRLRGAGRVALTLDGLVIDGRAGWTSPASDRARGGVYAYYADQVTLRNTVGGG